MKNRRIIKSVVLCLIVTLSLGVNTLHAQCYTVYPGYDSHTPDNPVNVSDGVEACPCETVPGGQEVCITPIGGYLIYTTGAGCAGASGYCIASMPLSGASYLLVFLLGIYGIYIYRKRVAVK